MMFFSLFSYLALWVWPSGFGSWVWLLVLFSIDVEPVVVVGGAVLEEAAGGGAAVGGNAVGVDKE